MKKIDIRALFKKLSKGADKISIENLKSIAADLNENYTEEDLKEMIKEADKDKDGLVSLDEFSRILENNKLV
jgi:Ca2+-binding EF-hand superfamily protein